MCPKVPLNGGLLGGGEETSREPLLPKNGSLLNKLP